MRAICFILCICGLLAATQSPAAGHDRVADLMDVEGIEEAVRAVLGRPVGAPGGLARPIDRALHLPACPYALSINVQPRRVRVGCPAKGWAFALDRLGASASDMPRIAPAVRKGGALTVLVQGGGFAARVIGHALADGAPGAIIPVRHQGGGTIRARVLDAETATAVD